MGKQFTFLAVDEDYRDFQARIEATGDVRFVRDGNTNSELTVVDDIVPRSRTRVIRANIYIVRKQDLRRLTLSRVKVQGTERWFLEEDGFPVISLEDNGFRGNVLRSGRFYIATDLRFRPKLLDAGARRWVEGVFRTVKRPMTYDPDMSVYVTERAKEHYPPVKAAWLERWRALEERSLAH